MGPHSVEPVVAWVLELVLSLRDIAVPGHERGVVVGAEAVPVLDPEESWNAVAICRAEGSMAVKRRLPRSSWRVPVMNALDPVCAFPIMAMRTVGRERRARHPPETTRSYPRGWCRRRSQGRYPVSRILPWSFRRGYESQRITGSCRHKTSLIRLTTYTDGRCGEKGRKGFLLPFSEPGAGGPSLSNV